MILICGLVLIFIIIYCILNNLSKYSKHKRRRIKLRLYPIEIMCLSALSTFAFFLLFLIVFNKQLSASSYIYRDEYHLRNINDNENPSYYKYDKNTCIAYAITKNEKEIEIEIPIDGVDIIHDNENSPKIQIMGYKIEYPVFRNILLDKKENENKVVSAKIIVPYENNDYFKYRNETNIY